jgi:protein-S-isoprenylcysteine O-methyltransferase Ste14
MLPDDVIAVFLVLSLALFLGRSLYESKKSHGRKEVEPTASEPILILGAVFALVFYLEAALYVILFLLGIESLLTSSIFQLHFPFDYLVQTLGIAIMIFGYILVFWSLHALEYGKLVTWGPYCYVRHPQYVAYFFIFGGFFLTLLNLIALLPLLAIPSEIRMATIEEEFLTQKYGDEYIRYQQKTGKFVPKRKKPID